MVTQKTHYFLTTEDFKFIYGIFEKEGEPLVRLINMLRIWQDNSFSLLINGKPLSQSAVKEIVDNEFENPPKIDFCENALWAVLYCKDRNFMITLHKYFKPKGFDIMERFSKWITTRPTSKIWTLMPSYLFYLHQNKSDHTPEPEDIFFSIKWIASLKKKYTCPFALSLLSYAAKNPKIYNPIQVIDLFVYFTKEQYSIPKSQIKKYEELLDTLQQLDTDYWNLVASETPELKKRLSKKVSSNYEVEEHIGRNWTLDIHNLSIKNGNFNVRTAKENFDKFFEQLNEEIKKNENVINFIYQNNDAVIKISLAVFNTSPGRDILEYVQEIFDAIYTHTKRSYKLSPEEIKRIWQATKLRTNLTNQLSFNNLVKKKINKI